jgi:hypothetical protein
MFEPKKSSFSSQTTLSSENYKKKFFVFFIEKGIIYRGNVKNKRIFFISERIDFELFIFQLIVFLFSV